MWLIVFFDLPVTNKTDRKKAATFRRQLLRDGFTLMQYSVYIRHCASYESLEVHKSRIKAFTPCTGTVSLVTITDRQYGEIETICTEAAKKNITAPAQLEFF